MEAEEAAAAIFGSDAGSDGGARPGDAPPPKKKRRRLRYRRMSAATAVARERLIRAEQERTAAGEAVEAAQRRVEEEALALANALRHQQDMRPRVKAAQEAVVDAELHGVDGALQRLRARDGDRLPSCSDTRTNGERASLVRVGDDAVCAKFFLESGNERVSLGVALAARSGHGHDAFVDGEVVPSDGKSCGEARGAGRDVLPRV